MMQEDGLVRTTTAWVVDKASHVRIDDKAVEASAAGFDVEQLKAVATPESFDAELHYVDGTPLTVQYVLVVDAMNFCFWPEERLEYEHLAGGVKRALQKDPEALSAARLKEATAATVRGLLGWEGEVPLEDERARLLREVGAELDRSFGGLASNLVEAAGHSAARLVELVTAHLPGFRDSCVYKGRQVFMYKRAQIFVGDVWGAFGGKGLGRFDDISALTMFADYRVPVVLREMGILVYTDALAARVDGRVELPSGGEEEIEIRAATVQAVERLAEACRKRAPPGGRAPHSVELDWWLWELGEKNIANHRPNHRTLTIFY